MSFIPTNLPELNPQQHQAMQELQLFLSGNHHVFILQGYAGTGKTTLIQTLIFYLNSNNRPFDILAPTGRAAKVLRDKASGYSTASTIHRTIYQLDRIDGDTEEDSTEVFTSNLVMNFPLKALETSNHVVIVDEASMVSLRIIDHEILKFGSGSVLNDLIDYTRVPKSGNKLIFVGDPAQLPPVGESKSWALDPDFFAQRGLKVHLFTLTDVIRQHHNSTILLNADKIRSLIGSSEKQELQLSFDNQMMEANVHTFLDDYLRAYPVPKPGNGVIINWRNQDCLWYNQAIRARYFPGKASLQPGDLLIVNRNSYDVFDGKTLYNGDIIRVEEILGEPVLQSARIYVSMKDKKIPRTFSFTFREIRFSTADKELARATILESMLYDPRSALDVHEMNALYVNFRMRLNESRKKLGLPSLKPGSTEFKLFVRNDPFLNALQLKFAYAITCHKAQGSEWDSVYVNYEGRTGLVDDHLRWAYTATTRARHRLTALHPPNISRLGSLEFGPLTTLSKLPADLVHWPDVAATPFHGIQSHPCKRLRYFETMKLLEDSPFVVKEVDSRPFLEIYYIASGDALYRFDTTHNGAGVFGPFVVKQGGDEAGEVVSRINAVPERSFMLQYQPGERHFRELFERVRSVCDGLGIQITGVTEKKADYFVKYYLYSAGMFGSVQFYFNANQRFTRALMSAQRPEEAGFMHEFTREMGHE
jgi:tRNA A37 threonylcarbamoyladenosine biosynthesis protein TsaE